MMIGSIPARRQPSVQLTTRAARVKITLTVKRLTTGGSRFKIKGKVKYASNRQPLKRTKVTIQQRSHNNRWHKLAVARTNSRGRYSKIIKLQQSAWLRSKLPKTKTRKASTSPIRKVSIAPTNTTRPSPSHTTKPVPTGTGSIKPIPTPPVTTSSQLWGWGDNGYGRLGTSDWVAHAIANLTNVVDVAIDRRHSNSTLSSSVYVAKVDGTVWAGGIIVAASWVTAAWAVNARYQFR